MSKIQVDAKRLAKLEKAERKLSALEAGGVDNWEWYSESMSQFFKEEEQEEVIQEMIENIMLVVNEDGDFDEPAGRGAGYSVNLDQASEMCLKGILLQLIKKYNEAGE